MEHRPTVPEVVRVFGQVGMRDVRTDPPDLGRATPEACSRHFEGSLGEVEYRDIRVSLIEQIIDEGRCAPSNVDHGGRSVNARGFEKG